MAEMNWMGFGLWRVAVTVFLVVVPAAAQPVTVEQLQEALITLKSSRSSEGATAKSISSFELTERLTAPTLNRMKEEFRPGRKTLSALELLSYSSSLLDPPASEIPDKSPPDPAEQTAMLNAAKVFVAKTLRHMPDFLAIRITRRFEKGLAKHALRNSQLALVDTTKQEIAYRDGRERVLGAAAQSSKQGHVETGGLTSRGEFGPILEVVLRDSSQGTVEWSHWEMASVGMVGVFHYKVPSSASHYAVDFCCESLEFPDLPGNAYHGKPAYHGSIAVDPKSGAILRVTIDAELDPSDPIISSAVAVDYGSVDIGGKSYICPVQSVAISTARSYREEEKRDTTFLRINEVVFTNYHRFGSTSRLLAAP